MVIISTLASNASECTFNTVLLLVARLVLSRGTNAVKVHQLIIHLVYHSIVYHSINVETLLNMYSPILSFFMNYCNNMVTHRDAV